MKNFICMLVFVSILAISNANADNPVDKVNCMSGHISHMLVPTYPTVHLPSSALRCYPNRDGAEKQVIKNFPLSYPAHRNKGVFRFSPFSSNALQISSICRRPRNIYVFHTNCKWWHVQIEI